MEAADQRFFRSDGGGILAEIFIPAGAHIRHFGVHSRRGGRCYCRLSHLGEVYLWSTAGGQAAFHLLHPDGDNGGAVYNHRNPGGYNGQDLLWPKGEEELSSGECGLR